VFLPPGTTIDTTRVDEWVFPVGTRFWKEFEFAGRKVETRLLWKTTDRDWVVASYVWNAQQDEAVLAPEEGIAEVVEIAPGRRYGIPSRLDCLACHDSGRTEVLGFTALQLSTDRDPNAVHQEPLTAEMVTLQTLVDEKRLLPARQDLVSHPPRIHADNPRTRAVLGYLSANCGGCHNQSSLTSVGLLLKQPSRHAQSRMNPALNTTIGRSGTWTMPGGGTRRQQNHRPRFASIEHFVVPPPVAPPLVTNAPAWHVAER
jgi:hypothetical protein